MVSIKEWLICLFYESLIEPIRATCSVNLVYLGLNALQILDGQCKTWSCALCSILQHQLDDYLPICLMFCSRRIVSFIWVRLHACALQRKSLWCIVCSVVYVWPAISVSRLSHFLCLPPVSHILYLLARTLLNKRPTVDRGNAAGYSHTTVFAYPKITLNGYCSRHYTIFIQVDITLHYNFACCLIWVCNLNGRT